MPQNTELSYETWQRYVWVRDNGHLEFVRKARACEDFFVGIQWDLSDLAILKAQRRPALTINKIISTISNVLGEQIYNRTEITFKPRNEGASDEVADALTKVFMQISDNNQLPWLRSDVFADGIITSRGFYDVRLDFSDSLKGEIRISQVNPKNVLIDPDADEYDPDSWSDIIVSKWLSPDSVALLYNKDDADILRERQESYFPYGYDAVDRDRDRFGAPRSISYGLAPEDQRGLVRNVRILDRQWRKLDMVKHFVDVQTGDLVPVPFDWEDDKISEYLSQNPGIAVTKKLIKRIRWTVVAEDLVLHDDWSPYNHFTIVPYFPYFRRGRTVGLVENLLGPQELLNKVSSQELHVVNTTANSGWKIKRNALQNMSTGELEEKGSQTGLVIELDDLANAEKIQPNQTPQGLDRISFKAEDHIKSISGVSDYMSGFAREDVAAKSVVANTKQGSTNLAKVQDSLLRTDHILARTVLNLVQDFYSEERLVRITADRFTGAQQSMSVNQVTPEGEILNDLSLGEYDVVVASETERETENDSVFEQCVRLRTEVGVQIPDSIIIQHSDLRGKADIIKAIKEITDSAEAQAQRQLAQRGQVATVVKTEAEARLKDADVIAKKAKAHSTMVDANKEAVTPPDGKNPEDEHAKAMQEMALERQKMEHQHALDIAKMNHEFALKNAEHEHEKQMREMEVKAKAMNDRVAAVHQPKGKTNGK